MSELQSYCSVDITVNRWMIDDQGPLLRISIISYKCSNLTNEEPRGIENLELIEDAIWNHGISPKSGLSLS